MHDTLKLGDIVKMVNPGPYRSNDLQEGELGIVMGFWWAEKGGMAYGDSLPKVHEGGGVRVQWPSLLGKWHDMWEERVVKVGHADGWDT